MSNEKDMLRRIHSGDSSPACVFCSPDPSRVISGDKRAFAMLDGFPVTDGHALVIPRRHVQSFFELDEEEQTYIWSMVSSVRQLLVDRFAPDGFNIGLNDGQTVSHAHVHVIPRRNGDVPDPRGGVRNIISDRARYWER